MQIAVVADVHLHDLHGGYGWLEEGSGDIALRTLQDTMASTRVFNESHAAFLAVLDDIVRRGIRDVVLLGDYSDDGQPGAVAALKRILSSYEERHALRFFATFGNHDCFGPATRHQGKWLTARDGLHPLLVTSDENAPDAAVLTAGMIGMSTADALEAMADYGLMRSQDVLHWETPFGDEDALAQRYPAGSDPAAADLSYLVEPQDGLWLLIVDANVFHFKDDTWQVRSDAAWDHVLAQRPYMLDWITDVAERAQQSGKTLLAFSHYPALPLAMTGEGNARKVACTPDWSKRMPSLETGRLLAKAGMCWHFSGHLHVAGQIENDGLVNVAVPSPVAYPGGYVVVTSQDAKIDCDFIRLESVPGFDTAFGAYRAQAEHVGVTPASREAITASNYGEFLASHLDVLIASRYLPKDWPQELLAALDLPLMQLLADIDHIAPQLENWPETRELNLRQVFRDYYFLRSGGGEAINGLPQERSALYHRLGQAVRRDNTESLPIERLILLLSAVL